MLPVYIPDRDRALEVASQGRDAALLLGLVVLMVVVWSVLRIGDRITEKTPFKFLSRSLTIITLLLAFIGVVTVQTIAMEPAYHLEWALGLYVHMPTPLYSGVVFMGTVVIYFLRRPSRT